MDKGGIAIPVDAHGSEISCSHDAQCYRVDATILHPPVSSNTIQMFACLAAANALIVLDAAVSAGNLDLAAQFIADGLEPLDKVIINQLGIAATGRRTLELS